VSDGLLPGWSRSKLADVIRKTLGGDWGKSPEEFLDGRDLALAHVIRGTEVKFWQVDKGMTAARRALKVSSLTKRRLQAGDIIVEVSGGGPSQPVARTILIDEEALERTEYPLVCSNFFRLIRLHPELNPTFIEAQLRFLYSKGAFNEFQTQTTNLRNLNFGDFVEDTEVLIAPANEQHRIAAKLEKLLDKVDSCQKRLARIPILLKRLRQSVLDAACSGWLTADWREYNETDGEPDETGEASEGFPLLPRTWRWRPLQSVCDHVVDCPHSTPKWTANGRICIRTTNFRPGHLDLSEIRYVSEQTFKERIERLLPKPGDILYSREGGILGIACVIPQGVDMCLGQRMMLFRVKGDFRNELLMHWLNSSPILRRVRELTGGSASPHLNVRDIKTFPTPIPPVAEQELIVRRVHDLFSLANQIESRYAKAQQYVDALKQSILAKAFRGELVPQDPNDEPATALIERIRETRGIKLRLSGQARSAG
jgi:type I restriction enzyme, S subunit